MSLLPQDLQWAFLCRALSLHFFLFKNKTTPISYIYALNSFLWGGFKNCCPFVVSTPPGVAVRAANEALKVVNIHSFIKLCLPSTPVSNFSLTTCPWTCYMLVEDAFELHSETDQIIIHRSMCFECIYICAFIWSSAMRLQSNHIKHILMAGVKKREALCRRHEVQQL